MHIPKTAGTALSQALHQSFGAVVQDHPAKPGTECHHSEYRDFDFYRGHMSYIQAHSLGGDLITILRDPIDRFLSYYYWSRQRFMKGEAINLRTTLAAKYSLDEFVRIRDEPELHGGFLNRMTWQTAYGSDLSTRQSIVAAGISEETLVERAISNLRGFSVVGVHHDMPSLKAVIEQKYNIRLFIGHVNLTESRTAVADLSRSTRREIEQWVYLDAALFRKWLSVRYEIEGSLLS